MEFFGQSRIREKQEKLLLDWGYVMPCLLQAEQKMKYETKLSMQLLEDFFATYYAKLN